MHEYQAVASLLETALTETGAPDPGARMILTILDPTRADPSAVAFFARTILRDRGMPDLAIRVQQLPWRCPSCGSEARPAPAHPWCDTCGMPTRSTPGPSLSVCIISGVTPRVPSCA